MSSARRELGDKEMTRSLLPSHISMSYQMCSRSTCYLTVSAGS
jgi:hypothetical protein